MLLEVRQTIPCLSRGGANCSSAELLAYSVQCFERPLRLYAWLYTCTPQRCHPVSLAVKAYVKHKVIYSVRALR